MQKRGLGRLLRHRKGINISHNMWIFAANGLLLVVILWMFLDYLNQVEQNTLFEKTYLSKDISLLVNTIYASPGDLFYEYYNDEVALYNYNYDFKLHNVTIQEAERPIPVFYQYGVDSSAPLVEKELLVPSVIMFLKKSDALLIGEGIVRAEEGLLCPTVDTEDSDWKSKLLTLDPGHGYDKKLDKETGHVNPKLGLSEAELALQTSKDLQHGTYGLNIVMTRSSSDYVQMSERVSMVEKFPEGSVVSLHAGFEAPAKNQVIAYYSLESRSRTKSKKLGCLLLKRFQEVFPDKITGIYLIPISPTDYREDEENPYRILDNDKVGVLIELGNVNTSDTDTYLKKPEKVAQTIYYALQEYYG